MQIAKGTILALATALASGVLFSSSAWAQAANDAEMADSGVGDIVVTATKRALNLQEVPVAITALTGAAMRQVHATDSTDITAQVPGMQNLSPQGRGNTSKIFLRGIGSNDFGDAEESPITAYIDEFYILPPGAMDFGLYDLDRVEVLRGPQGTLVGRNSTGGSIQYYSVKPKDHFEAYVDAAAGSFDMRKIEGAINTKLTDTLFARASFLFTGGGGYLKNRHGWEPGGALAMSTGRIQLRYEPRSDLSFNAKVQYGRVGGTPTYYSQIPSVVDPTTGLSLPNPNGVDTAGYNGRVANGGDPWSVDTDARNWIRTKTLNALLRSEWTMTERIKLTSITGYLHFDRKNQEDCDGTPNNLCVANFPTEQKVFSQEVRLQGEGDGFHWTAGALYLHQDANAHSRADFNGITNFFDSPWTLTMKSLAVFGQAEKDLTETLSFSLGGRYTMDRKHFQEQNRVNGVFPRSGYNFTDAVVGGLTRQKYDLFSGDANLNWKITPENMIYARIARGAKAGGFNNGFFSVQTAADVPYKPEKMWAYEIGSKNRLFDRLATLNIAAFYYDYSSYQVYNVQNTRGNVSNAPAKVYGGEAELSVAPIDDLLVSGGVSLLHTRIYNQKVGTLILNRKMAMAPSYTVNGLVRYGIPLPDAKLQAQIDFNTSGNRYQRNFNDPVTALGKYFVVNASLTYVPEDGRWSIGMFVKNLTNRANILKASAQSTLNLAQIVYGPKRAFGGNIHYNF